MAAICVTPDGRYHGESENEATLRVKTGIGTPECKYKDPRVLNDEEWAQGIANPAQRAELCAKLGKKLV